MIYNMDAFHTVRLATLLDEASHIVDQYAKSIKYYKLKEEIEQLSKQGKRELPSNRWNQGQRNLNSNIMISSQAKKHYKISFIIPLMKEHMILCVSFQIK